MQKGLLKNLPEEVAPLALFGIHKYGDTEQVLLQPIISNDNYDSIVFDQRIEPTTITYIEITQAHEGVDDYWRRRELLKTGAVFSKAPVIKTGEGKNRSVSIPAMATDVEEGVMNEMNRILDSAKKKAVKSYPANTSLVIFFEDSSLSEAMNNERLDGFVKDNILKLNLSFSALYLVGKCNKVFREYRLS